MRTLLSLLLLTAGCAGKTTNSSAEFIYNDLPIAKGSALAGKSVKFKGRDIALDGTGVQVGKKLRKSQLTKADLSIEDLMDSKNKVRIISFVPSIDTKVCEQQTHYLSEKNAGLDQNVELITVSIDTPFAQKRFAEEAKIKNVTFLSDFRGGDFGKKHGLFIKDLNILSRGVIVTDKSNTIRYLQITPEVAEMPDMESAFAVARDLISGNH